MRILSPAERKKVLKKLNELYGVEKLNYLLLKFGKDKLRLYSGSLTQDDLYKLKHTLRLENVGIYFAREDRDEIRLTFDSLFLFENEIRKNILDIDDEQLKEWMKGNELAISGDKGFVIIRNKGNLYGTGKSTGEKITNYVPRERRIR